MPGFTRKRAVSRDENSRCTGGRKRERFENRESALRDCTTAPEWPTDPRWESRATEDIASLGCQLIPHGNQEGRFFHGYYREYCYLPLYIMCGEFVLCARLRSSNIDASAGALEEVKRIVAQIQAKWPQVQIVLRVDGGFSRDAIMSWCEDNGVDYVFGMGKNKRLLRLIGRQLQEAKFAV